MKKLNIKKKEHILYSIVLTLFIILSIIISLKHEYWADEANAWLIAADSSLIDLFTKYLHTDGHPALFHLIIKSFQLVGLNYDNFRIISLTFSTLGIALFLFKSNYKWYIKVLLPFTYFIFYQYTVVTRGYCLILLLLGLIAYLWNKRKEKPIPFTISLILLLSLESYTFLIAGSIYLLYIVDYINDYLKTKKHNKKYLICLIVLFISFLLTTLYVMPREHNTFSIGNIPYFISNSFITTFNTSLIVKLILSILITFLGIKILLKKKEHIAETILIISPLLVFFYVGYCNCWHNGILFLLVIFLGWIYNFSEIKLFNILMVIICIVQITWTISSSVYDYNETYSPSKEVANFIKEHDYKNMKIYGMTFYEGATNAYFEENIFDNWNKDIRFFYWNKNSNFYKNKLDAKSIIENDVDMLVVTPLFIEYQRDELIEYYDEYIFRGNTYVQTSKYEVMDTYVYVRK